MFSAYHHTQIANLSDVFHMFFKFPFEPWAFTSQLCQKLSIVKPSKCPRLSGSGPFWACTRYVQKISIYWIEKSLEFSMPISTTYERDIGSVYIGHNSWMQNHVEIFKNGIRLGLDPIQHIMWAMSTTHKSPTCETSKTRTSQILLRWYTGWKSEIDWEKWILCANANETTHMPPTRSHIVSHVLF